MLMPFEWVVGDSSKDHTVTASMFYDVLATVRYTTLRGITNGSCARFRVTVSRGVLSAPHLRHHGSGSLTRH